MDASRPPPLCRKPGVGVSAVERRGSGKNQKPLAEHKQEHTRTPLRTLPFFEKLIYTIYTTTYHIWYTPYIHILYARITYIGYIIYVV